MDMPFSLSAQFAPNLVADSVPEWWLASHGWEEDFPAVIQGDQDRDGMLTLDEWWADTVPTNRDSVLTITGLAVTNGTTRIEWKGGVDSWQFVERSEGNAPGEGEWIVILTNAPPTATETGVVDQTASPGPVFYRVRVERR